MSREIRRNGKTATIRVARKDYICTECHFPILRGQPYWSIVLNGSGLGSLKFPERTHEGRCLQKNLSRR
jgi:hypothetical protein